MTEPDYFFATNKAYDLLNEFSDYSFPTPIYYIIRNFDDIKLLSYTEAAKKCGISYDNFYLLVSSEYGFSVKDPNSNKTLILYNDRKDETVIRFTLAHELGHYCLKHYKDSDTQNKEANCFARNLLCPVPVAMGFGLSNAIDYSNLFYVSEPMAQVAVDKRNCDYQNITTDNYSNLNDRAICGYQGISLAELYGYSGYQYHYA